MMVDWFKSETVWFGILVALIPFLQNLLEQDFINEYPMLVSVIGVVILVLRKGTSKEVRLPFQRAAKTGRYL